jgi:type IV pilus assembly protein PilV
MKRRRACGFSLIEVLVALIIIAVGMLGLAKIQGLAYASTGTASQRSLASIQAASLVSAMRANHAYWSTAATATTQFGINFSGSTITVIADPGATMTGAYDCKLLGANAPCSTAQMAAYDVRDWLTSLNLLLPNPSGSITCPALVAAVNTAVACTITINWLESMTGINQQTTQGTAIKATGPSYSLLVVP